MAGLLGGLAGAVWPAPVLAHPAKHHQRLSKIGPAPGFTLTTQDGGRLSLTELRGQVVVVTFIYTSCIDTCPLLTAKLASLAPRLAAGEGPLVHFVAITVDPERDTPAILKHYSARYRVDGKRWTFLTGTPAEIREVARRYGVYAKKTERGDVDHTFLTSLIDGGGVLRVQYLGVRFDPEELLRDLEDLRAEGRTR